MAQREGITKVDCLRKLSQESIERIQRSKDILECCPAGQKIYGECFLNGYLNFHFREPRYKLHELNLPYQKAIAKGACKFILELSSPSDECI